MIVLALLFVALGFKALKTGVQKARKYVIARHISSTTQTFERLL